MFVSYDEYLEKVKRAVEYGVAYYNATPLVEDAVYDALYAELVEYETAHPNEVLDYSPTQRVGAEVQQGTFNKYTHKEKMLSLNNAFTDVDVQKFLNKVITEDTKSSIIIEPKIDGVAISLIYENGKLVTGVTRGDGYVGEDITNNIKQIVNIPQILNTTESIEIRGEAYISNRDFETINEFQQKNNKKLYANPRNLTSGTLKSLNPKEVKSRKVRFIAYYLNSDTLDNIETQEKSLLRLKSFGFEVPPFVKCKTNNDVEIMNIINTLNKNTYLYSIDGAVLKVNEKDLRTVIGETAHAPSWAIAFKYPPMEATTILKDIEWGVGRTGKITPVGILEPVRLSGSVVGRVSLHNEDFIKEKNIKIGSHVVVRKAAEIIPEVVRCVENTGTTEIMFPKTCPVCNNTVVRVVGEAAHKCINRNCPAQLMENVMFMTSKHALDIRGMGNIVVKKCVEKGHIKRLSDIAFLTREKLVDAIKSDVISRKIVTEIEESKVRCPFEKTLTALCIPGIGTTMPRLLIPKFPSIDMLMNASVEALQTIEGIGEVLATNIVTYFQDPEVKQDIEVLRNAGWSFQSNIVHTTIKENNMISNKTFVITGTLSKPRNVFEQYIMSHGGKIASSVSAKTDYVLCGEKAGSKLEKAKSLNVCVLSEDDFGDLIGGEMEDE